jgi:integrase
MGSIEGVNPMDGTEAPTGKMSEEIYAYSAKEIGTMIEWLGGTAQVAVTLAAFTGLSLGELQGFQWEDISGTE